MIGGFVTYKVLNGPRGIFSITTIGGWLRRAPICCFLTNSIALRSSAEAPNCVVCVTVSSAAVASAVTHLWDARYQPRQHCPLTRQVDTCSIAVNGKKEASEMKLGFQKSRMNDGRRFPTHKMVAQSPGAIKACGLESESQGPSRRLTTWRMAHMGRSLALQGLDPFRDNAWVGRRAREPSVVNRTQHAV